MFQPKGPHIKPVTTSQPKRTLGEKIKSYGKAITESSPGKVVAELYQSKTKKGREEIAEKKKEADEQKDLHQKKLRLMLGNENTRKAIEKQKETTQKFTNAQQKIENLTKKTGSYFGPKKWYKRIFKTQNEKNLKATLKELPSLEKKKIKAAETASDILKAMKAQPKLLKFAELQSAQSLDYAVNTMKKRYNAEITKKKEVREGDVNRLKSLVLEKTTLESDYAKAKKEYYDVKTRKVEVKNPDTNKPYTVEELKKKMVKLKGDIDIFNKSGNPAEIKTLVKYLKKGTKEQLISGENIIRRTSIRGRGSLNKRGIKRGNEEYNKIQKKYKADVTNQLSNLKQLKRNAKKGTYEKIKQYASYDKQQKLAQNIKNAEGLKPENFGTYSRKQKKILKKARTAKAIFAAFERTGIPMQVEDQAIKSIIEANKTKRNANKNNFNTRQNRVGGKERANQIYKIQKASRKIMNAEEKLTEVNKSKTFRLTSYKDKQIADLKDKKSKAQQEEFEATQDLIKYNAIRSRQIPIPLSEADKKASLGDLIKKGEEDVKLKGAELVTPLVNQAARNAKLQIIQNSPEAKVAKTFEDLKNLRAQLGEGLTEKEQTKLLKNMSIGTRLQIEADIETKEKDARTIVADIANEAVKKAQKFKDDLSPTATPEDKAKAISALKSAEVTAEKAIEAIENAKLADIQKKISGTQEELKKINVAEENVKIEQAWIDFHKKNLINNSKSEIDKVELAKREKQLESALDAQLQLSKQISPTDLENIKNAEKEVESKTQLVESAEQALKLNPNDEALKIQLAETQKQLKKAVKTQTQASAQISKTKLFKIRSAEGEVESKKALVKDAEKEVENKTQLVHETKQELSTAESLKDKLVADIISAEEKKVEDANNKLDLLKKESLNLTPPKTLEDINKEIEAATDEQKKIVQSAQKVNEDLVKITPEMLANIKTTDDEVKDKQRELDNANEKLGKNQLDVDLKHAADKAAIDLNEAQDKQSTIRALLTSITPENLEKIVAADTDIKAKQELVENAEKEYTTEEAKVTDTKQKLDQAEQELIKELEPQTKEKLEAELKTAQTDASDQLKLVQKKTYSKKKAEADQKEANLTLAEGKLTVAKANLTSAQTAFDTRRVSKTSNTIKTLLYAISGAQVALDQANAARNQAKTEAETAQKEAAAIEPGKLAQDEAAAVRAAAISPEGKAKAAAAKVAEAEAAKAKAAADAKAVKDAAFAASPEGIAKAQVNAGTAKEKQEKEEEAKATKLTTLDLKAAAMAARADAIVLADAKKAKEAAEKTAQTLPDSTPEKIALAGKTAAENVIKKAITDAVESAKRIQPIVQELGASVIPVAPVVAPALVKTQAEIEADKIKANTAAVFAKKTSGLSNNNYKGVSVFNN